MAAKKTPLYEKHISYEREVVNYAGWLLRAEIGRASCRERV